MNVRKPEQRTRRPDQAVGASDDAVVLNPDQGDRAGAVSPVISGFKIEGNELSHENFP